MKNKTEARIQQEIVMWSRANHSDWVLFSVPNETESVKELMYKKSTGLMPGAADLILLQPGGKTTFFEVKTPEGKQSEKQRIFEGRVQFLEFDYHLVRSLEQFKTIINGKTEKEGSGNSPT